MKFLWWNINARNVQEEIDTEFDRRVDESIPQFIGKGRTKTHR